MRTYWLALVLFVASGTSAYARLLPKAHFSGMYVQWGYNRECYTNSDIHFSNGSQYDFTLHSAHASDKPDYDAIWNAPADITIPQYSYRIGVYLNREATWAMELNFDHAKYVMNDDQYMHISGQVGGEPLNADTTVRRDFLHFEHTDGANFLHINYVYQHYLVEGKRFARLSYLLKGGAGVVIPRTDVSYMGHELNNRFHVAGYIVSAEASLRFYPLRNFFIELSGKGGFADYRNVLTIEGGQAYHHFWYGEVLALAGYDLNFGHHRIRPHRSTPTITM